MPRDINSTIKTALLQPEVKLFYAIELNFYNPSTSADAPLRFWTGVGTTTLNSQTYYGTGELLSISGLEEVADLKATGISLTLSGIPTSVVTAALAHEYHGRSAYVYFGVQGNANLTNMFEGYMDQLLIQDGPETSTIQAKLESKLIDLERTRPFRYTQESHAVLYSGDTFFSFVEDLQDKKIDWGKGVE